MPVFTLDDEEIVRITTELVPAGDHVGFEPETVLVAGCSIPPLLECLGDPSLEPATVGRIVVRILAIGGSHGVNFGREIGGVVTYGRTI
ncbi:hypothetical protein EXE41_01340 [Halorubrum sp. SD690R]|uniref:hypothetical protein n=1 Tax=Halorubrum ezzemoulense TaxID=337243 RepID=UPI000677DA69|nr:hypothetical protein [Halorubrum ezzemoulense]TKX48549.1 hypothetical protein EXE41_01340 [Halorubrum sp. SD690R]